MVLLEREAELGTLEDLRGDTVRGRGRVAVVSGQVAVGKTRLIGEFLDRIESSRTVVLRCSIPVRSEPGGSLALLRRMLCEAPGVPEATKATASLLDEMVFASSFATAEGEVRSGAMASIAHTLADAVLAIAHDRPVVIAVDDLHNADIASLQCLAHLSRRVGSARVLLLLTTRAGAAASRPVLADEILHQPITSHLRLRPLSVSGVEALIAEALGSARARRLAAACQRLTGGNPLLVAALLQDHVAAGAPDRDKPAAGAGLGAAVLDCLRRGDSREIPVARAAAVLDESSSPARIAALIGEDVSVVAAVLDSLHAGGVLRDGRLRHRATRTAVLDDVPPDARAAIHLRSAALMYHEGGSELTIADHLMAAGKADFPWAVPLLRDAAEERLATGDDAGAIGYLALACCGCKDKRQLAEIASRLAVVEARRDPSAVGRHVPRLTAALRDGHLPDQQVPTIARQLLWSGDVDEVRSLIEHVGTMAARSDRPGSMSMYFLRWWLAQNYPPLSDEVPFEAASASDRQLTPSSEATAAQTWAGALLENVLTGGPTRSIVLYAQTILQSFRLDDDTVEPLLSALAGLVCIDHLELAASWSDVLYQEAVERNVITWQAMLLGARAEIAVKRGDMCAARRHAEDALARLPASSWGNQIGLPRGALILAATVMGDLDTAKAELMRPVPDGMFESRAGLSYLRARGRYLLATGRPEEALRDFLDCGAFVREWSVDLPTALPWRSDAAEAHLQLGDRAAARDLLRQQIDRLPDGTSQVRGVSLRLLAATEPLEERPWQLDEAIGVLHRVGAEFELATALADLSATQLALGEPGRARLAAERAVKLARKCHASTLVARLHPMVAGGRTVELIDGGAELSDAEERVAALVCRGLTNREIAAKLFITLSTVEQHLTRVYRKLGVDSRADVSLALRMRALDGRPGLGESELAAEPPIVRLTMPEITTPVRSGRG